MAAVKGNYHTHSRFSDGAAPLHEYVEEARRLGLEYLGFSEHSPLPFPNSFALKEESIPRYFAEVDQMRKMDTGVGPLLYAGLEMDYIPGFSQDFALTRAKYPVDYVIGAVHLVLSPDGGGLWFIDGPARGIYDDGLKFYFGGDIRLAVTAYYRQVQSMIRNEAVDVVGHLDKITMHNAYRYFSPDEDWYTGLVEETLGLIREKDLIVEVNTRGLYKKRSDTLFPAVPVLERILRKGIRVMLSSDAHQPAELISLFDETTDLLSSLGFRQTWYLGPAGWEPAAI